MASKEAVFAIGFIGLLLVFAGSLAALGKAEADDWQERLDELEADDEQE